MWTGDDAKPVLTDAIAPDTPGRDVDSDELSFAKWRRSPSVERKKKKKSNLKHAITPEQMIYARQARSEKTPFQEDPASSGMESPSAAFAETVNKSTGYSPLNPTVSLHAAFQDLAPTAHEHQSFAHSTVPSAGSWSELVTKVNGTATAYPAAPASPVQLQASTSSSEESPFNKWATRIRGAKSRTASPAISTASPTVETRSIPAFLPSTATPPPAEASIIPAPPAIAETPISPTSARPSFASVRRALFQRAFFDSIKGVKFDDTHIYVYSARTRTGVAHKPLVVHARSDFLQAASSAFSDVYERRVVDPKSVLGRRADRLDYGYDCDSDLEDEEDDSSTSTNATSIEAVLAKATVSAAPPAKSSHTSREATPKSSTLSMTDLDVMSLDDFKSEHSIGEGMEETNRTMVGSVITDNTVTPLRTPSKPALSLSTNDAVLNWRAAQEKMTAVPVERALETPPPLVTKDTGGADTKTDISSSVVPTRERTLFIPDSAHKTWQALLLFLYNDDLKFAPLRSQRRSAQNVSDTPTCSPKSMYRLAAKLGLDGLKEKSFAALTQALSRENIVDELFSDFTWRYPEVLKMETDVFHRYSSDAGVQAAMAEKFQDIAYGQLPHSSVVLNSLFMRFIGAPSSTGTPRLK